MKAPMKTPMKPPIVYSLTCESVPTSEPAVPVTCDGCGGSASHLVLDPRGPYFFCGRSKCRPTHAP